jgi:hypothetical protein
MSYLPEKVHVAPEQIAPGKRLMIELYPQCIESGAPWNMPIEWASALHDLESLGLQFEYDGHCQMRAFPWLDPMRVSPIRVVFLWVVEKGRANREFDHILGIIRHGRPDFRR